MSADGRGDRRVWADEGLLIWDGRALELYKSDGRHDGWRVDARTVERWVVDDAVPGQIVLKLYTSSGHLAGASIPEGSRADIESILTEIDALRP